MDNNENLTAWHKKIRTIRIAFFLVYLIPINLYFVWSWQVWNGIITEQNMFISAIYGIGHIVATAGFISLMLLPKIIRRITINRRFKKSIKKTMRRNRFRGRRIDPMREGYYIYRVRGYEIGVKDLLDNKNTLYEALRIEFIGDVRKGKRGCIDIQCKPIGFIKYYFG